MQPSLAQQPIIIGITGTIGAGKGTVADYLVQKGFKHFSARAFIVDEIIRQGLPVNRDTMRSVSNYLRRTLGGDGIVRSLIEQARTAGGNAIVESVRSVDEVHILETSGAILLSVDAPIELRYERAVKRGSETDAVSFEKFCEQERLESQSENPAEQNLMKCRDFTDPRFRLNNGGSLEELYGQIEGVLEIIEKERGNK